MTHEADFTVNFRPDIAKYPVSRPTPRSKLASKFLVFKFVCDKGFALVNIPIILTMSVILLILNPFLNPGPLFFTQERMGKDGKRFKMWKFRTMSATKEQLRAHDAPLETHRITPFAFYLRKFRIDELPNFLNVLCGTMSVVGPRPDAWNHSLKYERDIKYYATRCRVRPGITGLAQVRGGYADSIRAVKRKARLDHLYIENSSIWLDFYIIRQTFLVIATGFGAK